jgi:Zn-finger nucleic acid-binding protein
MDAPVEPPAATPYRSPSSPPVAAPAHDGSASHDLGPLCPRCTRLLHATDGPDLVCGTCGGAFVDHGDLTARIDAARPGGPQPDAPRHARGAPRERDVHYARCPTCAQPMTRMNFGTRSGIILDVCRAHGTWFDHGELEAVLGFVREGGIEDPVTPPQPLTRNEEAEALLRVANAELRAEGVQQQRAVEQVTDLLLFLFGRGFRRRW